MKVYGLSDYQVNHDLFCVLKDRYNAKEDVQMKFRMKRDLKEKLMIACGAAFLIVCVLFYWLVIRNNMQPVEETAFTYTSTPQVTYGVEVRKNQIYEEDVLPENGLYISNYVKNIPTSFSYLIQNSEAAEMTGSYSIIARVESRMSATEPSVFWKKDFELVADKEFNITGENHQIQEEIDVDFKRFDILSRNMKELTDLTSYDVLVVMMSISYTIQTPYGMVAETAEPKIEIPLDQRHFSVNKLEMDELTGEMTHTAIVNVPAAKSTIAILAALLAMAGAGMGVLYFCTEPCTPKDLFAKKIKKIFHSYGQRLVGMNSNIDYRDETNKVRSMEDLIKISDELNKPIMYTYRENLSEINRFYVMDDKVLYIYIVDYPKEEDKHESKSWLKFMKKENKIS